jgi:hypothetical protein
MELSLEIMHFHSMVNAFSTYLAANASRLNAPSGEITKLTNLVNDWNPKLLLYMNPLTHATSTGDIRRAYGKLHPFVQKIKNRIKNDENIELTEADLLSLDIKMKRPRRNHVLPRDFAPMLAVISVSHLTAFLFARDPNHLKKRKKPDDVKSIGIKIAFTEVKAPPPADSQYRALNPVGKTRFHLFFKAEDVGMKVYIIAYYLNNRGEPGPDSLPETCIVN